MMKNISIGLAIALSVAGCTKKKQSENKEPPAPMVQETGSAGSATAPAAEAPLAGKDLADRYLKCVGMINDNKVDDFVSQCLAADHKSHDMDGEDMSGGADQMKAGFAMIRKAFPDWKLLPQLVMVSGRNILAVQLSTGTNTGPMQMPGSPEVPPTNKKVGTLMFQRLAINDQNKASEEWSYSDPTTMMGQLGLLPKGTPPVRPAIEQSWEGAPNVIVTADNDTEKKNLAVAKQMNDAFNAHKIPDMLALMSDDFVESDQAAAQDYKGKKDAEKGLKTFMGAFSDGKVTVDNSWAAGDYVVETGTFEGTNDGDMGPVKKTGKKVTMHYAEVSKYKDGKATNLWRFRNGMAVAMQLGLMQPPGAGGGSAAAGSAAPKK